MRYVCVNKDFGNTLRVILSFVAGCYATGYIMG
jgi:hypothetical protein